MVRKTLRVKITCGPLDAWYFGKIGEVFRVENCFKNYYGLISSRKIIDKEDCIIIKETMGKREELSDILKAALKKVNDKDFQGVKVRNKRLDVSFMVEFDDEEPKIMTKAEIIDSVGDSDILLQTKIRLVHKAWDESAKRFQPLVDELKRLVECNDNGLVSDRAKEQLNLIIKEP